MTDKAKPGTAHDVPALLSKIAKQRHEIARLTRETEQLRADKAALRFDLHKARAAYEQARGGAKG